MNVALEKQGSSTSKIFKSLSLLLSDTYVLYTKTQNFHWNVTGARFHQLHLFFEEQYTELAQAIDTIAEQIRAIGQRPPSSMKEFLELSSIKESSETLSDNEMLRELLSDHEHLKQSLRSWIKDAQAANDEGTADLLIERLRVHEKAAWMLASHLE